MTKKHFIALADHIKKAMGTTHQLTDLQIIKFADFCASQNPNFNRERWIGYIYGENGPNGGSTNKHMDER